MKKMLLLIFVVLAWAPAMFAQGLLYTFTADWWVNKVSAIPDVSSNGLDDILVGASDDRLYCVEGGGNSKGTILWSTTFTGDVWDVVSIADVNNDGIADAIAGTADNAVYCISGNPAFEGAEIWSFTTGSDDTCVAVINDINNDGIQDCLAGSHDNKIYCISGNDGTQVWAYTTGSTVTDVCSADDVNNNGHNDVFAVSLDDKVYCISAYVKSPSDRLIWSTTVGDVRSVDRIEDVNNDGINDCICGGKNDKVTCLSGVDGSVLWTFTAGASIHAVAGAGDVNNDGVPDCFAGSADNNAYAVSGSNGNKIWERQFNGDVWAVAAIPDVNQDGFMECLAGTGNNDLAVINGASSTTGSLLWSNSFVGDVFTVNYLPDVTGNGIVEVMGGSNDSYVRVYEGNSTVTPVELDAFHASIQQTDVYLEWNTATETNNYGFILQRSQDNVHYSQIAFVPGNGTHSAESSYDYIDHNPGPGFYYYRLLQIDYDGTTEILDTLHINMNVPESFTVLHNYPNPFNAGTVIRYTIPNADRVDIFIYNIRGELIRTLYTGQKGPGYHSVHWDGKNKNGVPVSSGRYICSIKYGNQAQSIQMSHIK